MWRRWSSWRRPTRRLEAVEKQQALISDMLPIGAQQSGQTGPHLPVGGQEIGQEKLRVGATTSPMNRRKPQVWARFIGPRSATRGRCVVEVSQLRIIGPRSVRSFGVRGGDLREALGAFPPGVVFGTCIAAGRAAPARRLPGHRACVRPRALLAGDYATAIARLEHLACPFASALARERASRVVSRVCPRVLGCPKPGSVCYGWYIAVVPCEPCLTRAVSTAEAFAGGKAPVLCVTVERQRRSSPRRCQKRTGGRLPSEVAWREFKLPACLKNSTVSVVVGWKGGTSTGVIVVCETKFHWQIERRC